MYNSHNDPQFITWLQASILLHVILSATLYISLERETDEEITLPEPEAAPVIFQDLPEPEPIPEPPPQDTESELFKLGLQDDSKFGTTPLYQDIPEIGQPQPEEMIAQEIEKIASNDTSPELLQAEDINNEPVVPPISQDNSFIDISKPKEQSVKKKKRRKRKKQQSASPINGLTLADLADGFLDFVKTNKGDSVDINSGDLKTVAYNNKIGWYLQNSFRIHNRPLSLDKSINQSVMIYLEIDKDGKLMKLDMQPKTGEADLDNLLLKVIRNAHPVPPIPAHLNRSTYKYHLPIFINAAQGTHRYYFTFKG